MQLALAVLALPHTDTAGQWSLRGSLQRFAVIGRGTEQKWLCKFLCFYESFVCPKVVAATSSCALQYLFF